MRLPPVLYRCFKRGKHWLIAVLAILLVVLEMKAQQIQWAKNYPLPQSDAITCLTKDNDGYLYAGGVTARNRIFVTNGVYRNKAMLIKINEFGDTVFIRDLGVGTIYSMTIDPFGLIRANVAGQLLHNTLLLTVTPNGFLLLKDSIQQSTPRACMIGKDSSLIVVGTTPRTGLPAERSMYFQRIKADGSKDPLVELNPNHPNCVANRVEQLPNGHYLVSGYVGSRIASYELDELGSNPIFKQWYQTPDLSNMYSGYVGRVGSNNWYIGGDGGPCFVANYDSLFNKLWMHKEVGVLYPPQGMTDGSIVYGFNPNFPPYNVFYKRAPDSTTIWYMNVDDSLQARGIIGSILVSDYTYFEDQSAIIAGTIYQGSSVNQRDPFFMKVANVGTPVTPLIKAKKGPLANETLAPWPNPTGGTLYLKQHFDKAEVHLYNLAGKEVGEYRIGFAQPIDISGYESGVYLYRAVVDGRFYSGKVVKR